MNMFDGHATIPLMSTDQLRPIRRDPNVRHARDLPFTAAQAAAVARVLDEIRTNALRRNASGRYDAAARNRAGGVSVLTPPARPQNGGQRYAGNIPIRPNSRFSDKSGTSLD